MTPISPPHTYWSHVWAIPCNAVPECSDGRDEMNCQMQNWVLEIILVGIICLLCVTLFLYLSYYVEHTAEKIVVIMPSSEQNLAKRILHIAILIEEGNIDKIREFYDKEIETHGNEANAICCLKVDWLMILVHPLKMFF